VTDLLERIRTQLDQRLAALRPSVDEYERLRRGAEALAGVAPLRARGAGAGAGAKPAALAAKPAALAAKPARRAKPRPATKAARARPGQTQLRVIEVLRAAPGSTSTAVAKAVGISANAAAATISRLVKQGRVQRRAEGGYITAELASTGAASPPSAAAEPVAVVKPGPAAALAADVSVEPEPVATAEPPAQDSDPSV
jgi:hypothetical protein